MRSCPTCFRSYPDDSGFCPIDGVALQPAAQVRVHDPNDPRVGQQLSRRYELRRIVADGGMGRVYEGIDHAANTRIAVKILHNDVATDEIALERFKREYEISRALRHPNVVTVHDFANEGGVWFLVMEYLDGEELRLVLDRKEALEPARLLRAMAQAARGLEAAHEHQYVHRDLKPDNLFLCGGRDGEVLKILDFGSVKDKNLGSKKLTVVGTTLGSPYYMAPEQAQGLETLDGRADVFSLAAIVYECVCGKVPFEGANAPQILMKILSAEPKPPTTVASVPLPAALDIVLLEQGLAKNPRHRADSVGAFVDALLGAWGLPIRFREAAEMPVESLRAAIAAAAPRLTAGGPSVAVEAARDPFAPAPGVGATFVSAGVQPPPQAMHTAYGAPPMQAMRGAPSMGTPPAPASSLGAMDRAFAAAGDEPEYVVPAPRPPWVLPAVLGSVFAVVLVIVLILALR